MGVIFFIESFNSLIFISFGVLWNFIEFENRYINSCFYEDIFEFKNVINVFKFYYFCNIYGIDYGCNCFF